MAAIESLDKLGVVVFVEFSLLNTQKKSIPPVLWSGIKKISGNSVPMAVLTSANYKMDFGSFGYGQMRGKKMSSVFSDAKKKIRDAKKLGALALLNEASPKPQKSEVASGDVVKIEFPEMLSWTSAKGKTIQAALIRVENKKVYVLKLKSGKEIKIGMKDLSPKSQGLLKEIVRDI